MSSRHSIGAMNQLADALDEAGFTPDLVTKLKQYKELEKIKLLLNGCGEVVQIRHIIDCDADPFVPDGWKIEKHLKGGKFEWNADKVSLYLSKEQEGGSAIEGNKLRKKLEKMPVLNANVLDYLLKNPQLIPEDWKGKAVFFWGTIYRCSDGSLCVRYLYWGGGEWDWGCSWLGDGFLSLCPAAVCAS
ncbi:MAG: hypothetical protein PHW24_04440 [Candidatus Moranbacteria bacterium]|nr:hypothetical protein [Candidatus Moranbacteria bacterium]